MTLPNKFERRVDTGLVNYSEISTIVGWDSAYWTTKLIHYYRDGPLLLVIWSLIGTSNSNLAHFSIPFPYLTGSYPSIRAFSRARDNTGPRTPGFATLAAGESSIYLYYDTAANSWTSSGIKESAGEMIIPVA